MDATAADEQGERLGRFAERDCAGQGFGQVQAGGPVKRLPQSGWS